MDGMDGSYNTFDNLSGWMCSKQNRREKFKCIWYDKKTNESKILIKDISCDSICKFNGWKCNSNQKWIDNKCQCECKNRIKKIKKIIPGIQV